MSDTLGFCLYCKDHYLQDDGHSCMEARSGLAPAELHDPTTCRQCKNAEAAENAHEQMAQYTIPGKVRVEIGWIGEGNDGDFNAANPGDEPLLRFDAYDLTKHADTMNCTGYFDCCRGAQDASYCTRLSAATPVPVLESVCRAIAEDIVDEERWKKRLEELSWLNSKDADYAHRKFTSSRTSVKAGDIMYSRDGKLKGRVVSLTARGCHEGCLGTRLAVRWSKTRITYPCSAGLIVSKDGNWQIA